MRLFDLWQFLQFCSFWQFCIVKQLICSHLGFDRIVRLVLPDLTTTLNWVKRVVQELRAKSWVQHTDSRFQSPKYTREFIILLKIHDFLNSILYVLVKKNVFNLPKSVNWHKFYFSLIWVFWTTKTRGILLTIFIYYISCQTQGQLTF